MRWEKVRDIITVIDDYWNIGVPYKWQAVRISPIDWRRMACYKVGFTVIIYLIHSLFTKRDEIKSNGEWDFHEPANQRKFNYRKDKQYNENIDL